MECWDIIKPTSASLPSPISNKGEDIREEDVENTVQDPDHSPGGDRNLDIEMTGDIIDKPLT